MDASSNLSSVRRFNGEGYRQWKFVLRCYLAARELASYMTSEMPTTLTGEAAGKWRLNDAKALSIITSALEFSQVTLIETCNTACEVIIKLDSIYEQKSENSKMILHEKFHRVQMNDGDSVAGHISKIENLANQLKDMGENIPELSVCTKILGTLPEKYRVVRQAWLSLDPSRQTVLNLTARLLDEESYGKSDEVALAVSSNKKKLYKCFKCHKRGHFAKDCRARKAESKQIKPESAFIVDEVNVVDEDHWILDSGASAHMTYRKDYFSEFRSQGSNVRLGDKSELNVEGVGTVKILKLVDQEWYNATINNVLYVPNLKRNLLSEGVMTSKGFSVLKNGLKAEIRDESNTVVACAVKQHNNLYKLLFKTITNEEANVVTLKEWHERLGHVNVQTLRAMVRKGQLPNTKDEGDFLCEACMMGKQHRLPFKSTSTTTPKEKIYSDLCGPMPIASVGGAKYFITFIDGHSRYVMIYFLREKSEALQAFKKYVELVQNKYGMRVKVLHTDNGKEYCNNNFKEYAEKLGIQLESSAPYTPQQNGRCERANRTIMEGARTMIYARKLPLYLWAEAALTMVYVMNRRTNTGEVTPYEIWTGQKPNWTHMRTFGSIAYMHVPKEKRNKLDSNSKKLILVGYDGDNYRLFDQGTKKISISHDVMFNEKEQASIAGNTEESYALLPLFEEWYSEAERNEEYPKETSDEQGQSKELNTESVVIEEGTSRGESGVRTQSSYNLRSRHQRIHEANLTEIVEPTTFEEAISSEEKENWKEAIEDELKSHEDCGTWKFTALPEGKKTVGCKWVFRLKVNVDNSVRFKARLCAKGYTQEKGIDYMETFSPTVRYDTIRAMIALAARDNLLMTQFDVKTAFLYGTLDEEIYMTPPPGLIVPHGHVCKLIKSLYGLKQSPRCWNKKFDSFLKTFGFSTASSDTCLYISTSKETPIYLLLYVDDGLVLCKSKDLVDSFLTSLKQNFEVTIMSPKRFIGLELEICDDKIFITQKSYVTKVLKKFNMFSSCKAVSIPADPNVKLAKCDDNSSQSCNVPYREAVGSIMYAAIGSRPDIYYASCNVSKFLNCYSNVHWSAVKQILKYLNQTLDYGISYQRSTNNNVITMYSDADYGNCTDTRKSVSGYVSLFNGGAITWSTRQQKCVTLSTAEAEYVAACAASKDICWLKQLFCDVGCTCQFTLCIDNQSAIRLIEGPISSSHKRTKHIDIQFHFVREKFLLKYFAVKYADTKHQAADILTKAVPRPQFEFLRGLIGVIKF